MNEPPGTARNFRHEILFVFALALACYLAWLLRDVLLLLYVCALFAVVLAPLVRSTSLLRIGRWQPFKGSAIFILLLAAAAAIAAFGFLALPPVIADLQEFAQEMPSRVPALLLKLQSIPLAQHLDNADLISQIQGFASHAAAYLLSSVRDWAGILFDAVMGLILTIYFILEGDRAYLWFLSFFPPEGRERLDKTLQRAEIRMGRWLLGQGSLMLILGICSTLTFVILKVRYAYALGVLMGALNIIPVLGGAIGISLALLSASIDSWGSVIGVAVFYAIYLWIENSFLIPSIMQNRLNLPGLAVLVSLLIGSAMAGILGATVAIPTAVLVAVLLEEYAVVKDSK